MISCAIYTRKSTSEGLDGEFTTLDNQRDAALSYIASQKSLGWTALLNLYDDGGFTGANMDRPALRRLLDDIKAGLINCVVVYKVDRLSRSLTDFAKLLEFFEAHNVTFVSVTQHFNTQNSMGRLTLNILLSFAQFEREMISERTKDKMAAARKKGHWVGGPPVLGYDVDKATKTLVINRAEAALVREIFRLYVEKRSLMDVANTLNERGLLTKRHVFPSGRVWGGRPFDKTDIAYIVSNYTYIGKVRYAGEVYDGVHEAIIKSETFATVQALRMEGQGRRNRVRNSQDAALLRHILWCAHCKTRMIPIYSSKRNIKYRYYVCHHAQHTGYANCPVRSVNAQKIESLVVEKLAGLISKAPELTGKNLVVNTPVWDVLFAQERRRVINRLLKSVEFDSSSNKLAMELNELGIEALQMELA